MKILKCTTCGLVMQTVQATIEVGQLVRLDKDGSFYIDDDDGFDHVYGEPVTPIDESFSCPECDTPKCHTRTVEIMEVEKCPHIWERGWSDTQVCRLCDGTRQGRLVFE